MRILTVPNWSFGRDSDLLRRFGEVLERTELDVHYLKGDVDHNRTVSAFSGESSSVFRTLIELARLALDRIDLNHHVGVHPRIGALDVCPFIPYQDEMIEELKRMVEEFAAEFASNFSVPTFLYERSERGRHESQLPNLRKGGFGSLIGQILTPDFGPNTAHPRCGVTIVGVRDFLVAMNVDLKGADPADAKDIARQIRGARSDGDERFLGVRALGFPLASRGLSQVSMNLTLPDLTAIDPIVDYVIEEARRRDREFERTELIGVIRPRDLISAERLQVDGKQVVPM